jgi:hypothetical protein
MMWEAAKTWLVLVACTLAVAGLFNFTVVVLFWLMEGRDR